MTAKTTKAGKTAAKSETAAPSAHEKRVNDTLAGNVKTNLPNLGKSTPKAAAGARVVHAYRREPIFDEKGKEQPVEVSAHGETIKFTANAEGHVVATVKSEELFKHLTKNIPEAYIEYKDGKNVPERVKPGQEEPVVGKFVLRNGDQTLTLDDLDDAALKAFAESNALQLHESLEGDDLRQAIFNRFQTGG